MGKLNETTKIIAKTGPTGEMDFEKVDADVAQRLNGQTVTDTKGNKQTIKDTGKTVNEEMEESDYIQLGTQLAKSTAAALKEHGDEIAMMTLKGASPQGCTVHIEYKPNEQGVVDGDDFKYEISPEGIITLGGQEICQVSQISGTASIQKDLVKDAVLKFINSKSNPVQDANTSSPDEGLDEDLLLGFRGAVENYRKDPKNKESIKELFRQARGFEGDDIQHKFQNAVNAFKSDEAYRGSDENIDDELGTDQEGGVVAVEEPVVSPQDDRSCECDLNLDMSLFIRLLEYAKEEAKEDVDLHFVAENLQKVCNSKGCATMEDYDDIISESGADNVDESYDENGEHVDSDIEPDPDAFEKEVNEGYLDSAIIGNLDPDYDSYLAFCEENDLDPNLSTSREEYRYSQLNGDLDEEKSNGEKLNDKYYRMHLRDLDKFLTPEGKNFVMDKLSDEFGVAESLDDSIEEFVNHMHLPLKDVMNFLSNLLYK